MHTCTFNPKVPYYTETIPPHFVGERSNDFPLVLRDQVPERVLHEICPLTALHEMATQRVTAPELEQFVLASVQLTGVTLGAGAYGSVEEVEIPGARVAAKKLHSQLINLGSSQQVTKVRSVSI